MKIVNTVVRSQINAVEKAWEIWREKRDSASREKYLEENKKLGELRESRVTADHRMMASLLAECAHGGCGNDYGFDEEEAARILSDFE